MNGVSEDRRDGWSNPSLADVLRAVRSIAAASPVGFAGSVVLALLGGVAPGAAAWAIGNIMQAVEEGFRGVGSQTSVLLGLIVLGTAVLCAELSSAAEPTVNAVLSERYTAKLHEDVMASISSIATIDVYDDPQLAERLEVARWASNEPSVLVSAVWHLGRWIFTVVSTAVVASAVWWAPLVIIACSFGALAARRRDMDRQADAQLSAVQARLQSSYCYRLGVTLPAAKELRTLGLQRWLADRQSATWERASEPVIAEAKRGLRRDVVIEMLRGICVLACILYVASVAVSTPLSASEITTTALGLAALLVATTGLEELALTVMRSVHFFPNLLRLASMSDVGRERALACPAPYDRQGERGVRFESVSFTYPGSNAPAIHDLNLFVPAGQIVAVIGANGSGKSTLLKLLCGLYEPDAGHITIDGVDLRAIDRETLWRNIAPVFQDHCQYPMTLADNVMVGCVSRLDDMALLEEVAAVAGLDSIVQAAPEGWRSEMTRDFGATELSGGEWQRVALARCAAAIRGRRASLVVLDEPTACFDRLQEEALLEGVRTVVRGCTTILVTHRLGLAARTDHVVVMHGGSVVDEGPPGLVIPRIGRGPTRHRRTPVLEALRSDAYA